MAINGLPPQVPALPASTATGGAPNPAPTTQTSATSPPAPVPPDARTQVVLGGQRASPNAAPTGPAHRAHDLRATQTKDPNANADVVTHALGSMLDPRVSFNDRFALALKPLALVPAHAGLLLRAAGNADEDTRYLVASLLLRSPLEAALPALERLLADPSKRVAEAAWRALSVLTVPRARDLALAAVGCQRDGEVRLSCAHTLSRFDDDHAVAGLLRLAVDQVATHKQYRIGAVATSGLVAIDQRSGSPAAHKALELISSLSTLNRDSMAGNAAAIAAQALHRPLPSAPPAAATPAAATGASRPVASPAVDVVTLRCPVFIGYAIIGGVTEPLKRLARDYPGVDVQVDRAWGLFGRHYDVIARGPRDQVAKFEEAMTRAFRAIAD